MVYKAYGDYKIIDILFIKNFLYCYQGVTILFIWSPVHSGVNLTHFKGAHLDFYETYMVKLTQNPGLLTWPEHACYAKNIFLYKT